MNNPSVNKFQLAMNENHVSTLHTVALQDFHKKEKQVAMQLNCPPESNLGVFLRNKH